jgi:hypothetical protein
VTGEPVTVTAPMPKDMEKVLKALRNAHRVVRAEAGLTGEEGLYKPRITKARKLARVKRSERFAPQEEDGRPGSRRTEGSTRREEGGAERPRRADRSPRREEGGAERPRRAGRFAPREAGGPERPRRRENDPAGKERAPFRRPRSRGAEGEGPSAGQRPGPRPKPQGSARESRPFRAGGRKPR